MKNKILVTGGTGMVGQAVVHMMPKNVSIIAVGSKDCDLIKYSKTKTLFNKYKPDVIIHLAGKVGGIKANLEQPVEFFNKNIQMNTNVLIAAHECNIQNVVSLLSTCVYPDKKWVQYPLTEKQLHAGPPPESNFTYGYAKRMVEVQSRAYRKQYNRNYVTAIPNNIFGIGDSFDLQHGHVVSVAIRKIFEAKQNNTIPEFWGSGKPLRQFTYSDDIATCLLKMAGIFGNKIYDSEIPCNIGTNEEVSIKKVVQTIANILDYKGETRWDITKPEGQFRKPSVSTRIPHKYLSFKEGLEKTCDWFVENYPNIRGV